MNVFAMYHDNIVAHMQKSIVGAEPSKLTHCEPTAHFDGFETKRKKKIKINECERCRLQERVLLSSQCYLEVASQC